MSESLQEQLPKESKAPEYLSFLTSQIETRHARTADKKLKLTPQLPPITEKQPAPEPCILRVESAIPKLPPIPMKWDPRKSLVSRIPTLADVVPKGTKPLLQPRLNASLKKVKPEPNMATKPRLGASLRKIKSEMTGSILPTKPSAVNFSKPKSLKKLRSDVQLKGSVLPTKMSATQFRKVPMHLPKVNLLAGF